MTNTTSVTKKHIFKNELSDKPLEFLSLYIFGYTLNCVFIWPVSYNTILYYKEYNTSLYIYIYYIYIILPYNTRKKPQSLL